MYRIGLAIMAIAVCLNIIQFREGNKIAKNYRPIYAYNNENIFDIGTANNASVRNRAAIFYYFGVLSPNSTIIIPKKRLSMWFELHLGLMTFGRAKEIQRRDYDPHRTVEGLDAYKVDLSKYIPKQLGSRQQQRLAERMSIFRKSPTARTFVVIAPEGHPRRDKPVLFVDIDLLDKVSEERGDDS